MQIATQMKTLRSLQSILLGDGSSSLPHSAESKPSFVPLSPSYLPRKTPESQGIPSAHLEGFYREIAASANSNAHALLVLRNGAVVSEGYFAPYRKDVWHVSHSLCKTFTGTAVGMAIEEGLFAIDDPVLPYFQDKTSFLTSKKFRAVTVRHLLTMTSGISYNEISEAMENDWLKGIFSSKLSFEPGSQFSYNSMNSYLLAALVQRTSGMTLQEFLRPRLFEPLGFGAIAWEKCPEGITKGGWGMYLLIEDMAKLGQLYLQKGKWVVEGESRQLLSSHWVEEATRTHATGEKGEEYGYQIWIESKNNSFIMNGMFGQYVNVIPKENIVVAMTAGSPHFFTDSSAYTIIRRYFANQPFAASLPENPIANGALQKTLSGLSFRTASPLAARMPKRTAAYTRKDKWNHTHNITNEFTACNFASFCDKTWRFPRSRGSLLPIVVQAMDNNFSTGVKAIHLEKRKDNSLLLFWEEGSGTSCIPVGIASPIESTLKINQEEFLISARAAVKQNEDGQDVLVIHLCLLEHSSFRIIKLRHQNDGLLLQMDEQPQLSLAIESVIEQNNATNGAKNQAGSSLGNVFLNNDYLHYRIEQLCAPKVLGHPVHKQKNDTPSIE